MASDSLTDQQIERLVSVAVEVRKNAYAPYSKFQVGAVVLCQDVQGDEQIFAGCNVENASYGLSLCAERAAICTAVANQHQTILAVVVAASPRALPCGACRQFIHEFNDSAQVISVDAEQPQSRTVRLINTLIPDCFTL